MRGVTVIEFSGRTGVCIVDGKVYRDIKAIVFREAPGWKERSVPEPPKVGDMVCGDVFNVEYALIDLRTGTALFRLSDEVTVQVKSAPSTRAPYYFNWLEIRPAGPAPLTPREVVEIAKKWRPGHIAELIATKRRPRRVFEADGIGFWPDYQEVRLYRYRRARDYRDIVEIFKYPEDVTKVEFLNVRISPIWEWRGREVYLETGKPIYVRPPPQIPGEVEPRAFLEFFLISPWCNRVIDVEMYNGEPYGVHEDVLEKWAVKKRHKRLLIETLEPLPSA